MTQRFIITGLPRTRTAWLSMLCSMMPGAYCAHEPIARMRRWEDYFAFFDNRDWAYLGAADSSLGFHLIELMALNPRVLIIDRDPDEVEVSLARQGILSGGYCRVLKACLDQIQPSPQVRRVDFAALGDDDVVASCLWHLMPGVRVDRAKITLAQDMKIETCMDRVNEKVAAQRSNVGALLGPEVMAWIRQA